MPATRSAREKYVRFLTGGWARWHRLRPDSTQAREIERLANLFADEGMAPWEAVSAAAVLVLKRYGAVRRTPACPS